MRILNLIIIASLVSCFVACRKSENFSSNDKASAEYKSAGGGGMNLEMENAVDASEKAIPAEPKSITEQKLIKNGDISFEVKNIKDTKAFLQKVILKYDEHE